MRVLWENLLQKEFLGKREGLNLLNNHEYELRFLVEANVVVTDERVSFHVNAELELFLTKTLSHQVVANTNNSLLDEIHLTNFVLLVKDKPFFLRPVILSRSQPERNIIQELGVLVFLSVEEESESVVDIVK